MPTEYQVLSKTGDVATASDIGGLITFPGGLCALTPAGGFAVRMVNKTGGASVRGTLVTTGSAERSVVTTTANIPHAVGAIWSNGVADGGDIYVVVSGVAEVLFEDGQAPTVGYWCGISASVGGRAQARASLPDNSGAGVDLHNGEVGHILQTIQAGTNVKALVMLHFN